MRFLVLAATVIVTEVAASDLADRNMVMFVGDMAMVVCGCFFLGYPRRELMTAIGKVLLLVGEGMIVLLPGDMSFHDRVLFLLWGVIIAVILTENPT